MADLPRDVQTKIVAQTMLEGARRAAVRLQRFDVLTDLTHRSPTARRDRRVRAQTVPGNEASQRVRWPGACPLVAFSVSLSYWALST